MTRHYFKGIFHVLFWKSLLKWSVTFFRLSPLQSWFSRYRAFKIGTLETLYLKIESKKRPTTKQKINRNNPTKIQEIKVSKWFFSENLVNFFFRIFFFTDPYKDSLTNFPRKSWSSTNDSIDFNWRSSKISVLGIFKNSSNNLSKDVFANYLGFAPELTFSFSKISS